MGWHWGVPLVCPRKGPISESFILPFLGAPDRKTYTYTYVPWSKVAILGMVIPPLIGNPYNGYINPYYWVDDHPLLYGNNGSLDPSTCNTPPKWKTASGNPWKMVVGRRSFPIGKVTFEGQAVKLREGIYSLSHATDINWKRLSLNGPELKRLVLVSPVLN